MQNKGLIRLFAILFGIVSIYQLSFTFVANNVEDDAEVYAVNKISDAEENYVAKREAEESRYLDSLENQEVFNLGFTSFTYSEVKEKELNKGLDLKGGINVILQISVKDILKGLANNSKDPVFNKALAQADETSKNSQDDYIDIFFQEFEKVSGGTTKLASPDIFANKTLSEEINFQMTDAQVQPIIRKKINESIVSAFEVLRKRIDKFGVTQPNIQRLGTSGRILVELPGAKDVARVQNLLQSTAQLEFWETYKADQVAPFLIAANNTLKDIVGTDKKEETKEETTSEIDSLLSDAAEDSLDVANQVNPLFDLIASGGSQGSPVIAMVAIKDTAKFDQYLKMPEVKQELPANLQYAKFAWGIPPKDAQVVELYALKGNRENEPNMSGDVITDAAQSYDLGGRPAVSMQMNSRGAKIWEELTGKAFREQGNIAIVLDNIVYSAPGVSKGAISGGNSEISGDFTLDEADDLANVLRAGKLPASADIIQSEVVGPSLGQEAIDSGMFSFIVAMILVLIWMISYYGKAGLFADIALVFNIVLIFGVLAGLGAVLTLPGIAGIVLTIGMSVDANVIIYERIKEEIRAGKGQKQAIADGFSNALSSILDANITTGLTAIILLLFGTGPIQGFATTLLIGIATSLFTAIFVTRLLIEWNSRGGKNELLFTTALTRALPKNPNFDFLSKRKIAYVISGIMILISVVALFTKGLEGGVDFVGGRSYQVRFVDPVNPTDISNDLETVFGNTEVKTFGDANQIKVTTKYKVDEEGTQVDEEIQNKLFEAVKKYLPEGTTYNDFTTGGGADKIGILQSIKVGPTIADDIKKDAFWAILGSLAVVFLYILLRFQKWQFSLGAVVAVFHDVMIVLGIFSLTSSIMPFNMEIDQAFIAAILTVIGYSLNDTVIVFDRIREVVREKGWRGGDNANEALNSTLSRTLNTSLTTLVVLLAIFIFGGESLRGFMFAMIVGIGVGTYSSLFIATPVMFDTLKNKGEKKE
ncbi:protein translocase subunit SecDF [Galbibacter pacificus]|uniref:Multifunctional fusion protein n=1 Tax=Galbibacter pacificus TaxID=2996052 RepID=A0ABT6FMC6_9FLAO|nr:protein translocase subunit SecDF [Galbibacter pacificus]MDG3580927.1 protein translocase subunit SecDF [Galbibacter pacificus]MDG3584405.1 protein translocase subunit SecDF [Galbibacter pacificus]